jgi:hypothetical protein
VLLCHPCVRTQVDQLAEKKALRAELADRMRAKLNDELEQLMMLPAPPPPPQPPAPHAQGSRGGGAGGGAYGVSTEHFDEDDLAEEIARGEKSRMM